MMSITNGSLWPDVRNSDQVAARGIFVNIRQSPQATEQNRLLRGNGEDKKKEIGYEHLTEGDHLLTG